MIHFLLADKSFEPCLSTRYCHAFATTIGTPQCDSLSTGLFTVCLEAALHDLRSRLPTSSPADASLPFDVEYATLIFSSPSRSFLIEIESIALSCLAEWSLMISATKTERTSVNLHADRIDEEWS